MDAVALREYEQTQNAGASPTAPYRDVVVVTSVESNPKKQENADAW